MCQESAVELTEKKGLTSFLRSENSFPLILKEFRNVCLSLAAHFTDPTENKISLSSLTSTEDYLIASFKWMINMFCCQASSKNFDPKLYNKNKFPREERQCLDLIYIISFMR